MEWGSVLEAGIRNGRGDGSGVVWATSPDTGQLDPHDLPVAADILAMQTSCPDDCWFRFWEGLGFNDIDVDGPRMALPERHHVLFHGAVADAVTRFQGFAPSIWWPADRAWFVATDVDLMSTYVGSTTECASLLRDSGELEAIETSADRTTWWDSDTINPLPPEPI
ncbi:hypothetical protein OG921_04385 [Aldersonia sp. NBC_00410]|uniref:hypothetical protein n=1 Tax=Aldersonia sp. NBC_00410 TaxID=2975954 RepID=UPI00225A7C4D|nr:hypothetical protein [Aldersonia sp. NBC_00410]MCX5042418.1 hypothetical protein [Aldersonia sp. NBC_00410]